MPRRATLHSGFLFWLILFVFSLVTIAQSSAPSAAQGSSATQQQSSSSDSQEPQVSQPLPKAPTTAGGKSSKVPKTPAEQEREKEIERREQSQRVLGIVPQFAVTSRHDAPALSTSEKFHLMLRSGLDPFVFAAAGLQAGISQAEDEFPEYGQGAAGYGKRYGATLADSMSAGFFSNFAYAALFREDPRYFRLGDGPLKRRIEYALVQEFIAHKDNGGRIFHFANTLGALSSGSLSNAYYPESDRGFGLTISRAAIALGYGSLGGLLEEFWPDIHRALFKKRHIAVAGP